MISRYLSLLALCTSLTAHADLIEIGGGISQAALRPLGETTIISAPELSLFGAADLGLAGIDFDATRSSMHGKDIFQARVSGHLLFLQLHEFLYRQDNQGVDNRRVLLGFGGDVNLPAGLGTLTASVGAMVMDYRGDDQALHKDIGVYAGGKLLMKIWKIENELRVAYYFAPDESRYSMDGITHARETLVNADRGLLVSEHMYAPVFSIGVVDLGPELRAQIEQLPNGTQIMGSLGVRVQAKL